MTVCLAATCNVGIKDGAPFIVGAADRMITIETIEYEPNQTKLFPIASHTAVLLAGDMRMHAAVAPATHMSLSTNPVTGPLTVKAIAERYAEKFADHRRYINEQTFLVPLGIKNSGEFLVRQREMSPTEAAALREKLTSTWIDAPAIIAGIDNTGPHVYKVEDPGVAHSFDTSCFCAIGIGAPHAESQFMLAEYASGWPFVNALFLAYEAKVRAQSTSGVGVKTDVFYIGPQGLVQLKPDDIVALDAAHATKQAAVRAADQAAYDSIWRYITETAQRDAAQAAPVQQSPTVVDTVISDDPEPPDRR